MNFFPFITAIIMRNHRTSHHFHCTPNMVILRVINSFVQQITLVYNTAFTRYRKNTTRTSILLFFRFLELSPFRRLTYTNYCRCLEDYLLGAATRSTCKKYKNCNYKNPQFARLLRHRLRPRLFSLIKCFAITH